MANQQSKGDGDRETLTDGAIKAGDGNYFFDPNEIEGLDAGAGYSTAFGGVIEGERHQAGLMRMEAGTGADPHEHPNEQFIYVLSGELHARVADEETDLSEGSIIYVPPNTVHSVEVTSDEDVYFFTTKDLRHGIVGTRVDEQADSSG